MRVRALPFHIQHNTTPKVLKTILDHCHDGHVTISDLAREFAVSVGTVQLIIPFVRQLGLLNTTGLSLTDLGVQFYQLAQRHPALFPEAIHHLLYTAHACDRSKRFSWAYAQVVDALWTSGERVLDGNTRAQLVGSVVQDAAQAFGVPVEQVAFSMHSVRGVLNWLRALEPPVVFRDDKVDRFRRRYFCPIPAFLWAVDFLYRRNNVACGVRLFLTPERIEQLCKLCVLDPSSLDEVLMMAKRTSGYDCGGVFDHGTEDGFMRWLLLAHPCPVPRIPYYLPEEVDETLKSFSLREYIEERQSDGIVQEFAGGLDADESSHQTQQLEGRPNQLTAYSCEESLSHGQLLSEAREHFANLEDGIALDAAQEATDKNLPCDVAAERHELETVKEQLSDKPEGLQPYSTDLQHCGTIAFVLHSTSCLKRGSVDMKSDVLVAFELLLEAMNSEKVQLADAVREAMLNAQFSEAQRLLAKTERVERLMEQVRRLRKAWEQLDETEDLFVVEEKLEAATIGSEVDDEDAPELAVAERLFGGRRHRRREERQAVNRTPIRAYWVPILEGLEQLGGRGQVSEVLDLVYEKMKDRLTENDLKPLPTGRGIRWAIMAQWARIQMISKGLLRDDSPRGIWEITEKGRAYLEQARQRSEGEDEG